jgi:uncharacterized membrane protein HdeD (DUF308 family)
MTRMLSPSESDAVLGAEGRTWWVYLVTGALWIIFGFIVLSARSEITTVWAVAIYAGILFFLVGVGEVVTALVATGWRWLHALFGVAAIIAGVFAFAWPGQTFITLAVILAWYLLFDGIFQIVAAFYARGEHDWWWMFLAMGVIEVLVGFWAVGYPGRSVVLLVIWVGATALAKGFTQIVRGLALHGLNNELAPT